MPRDAFDVLPLSVAVGNNYILRGTIIRTVCYATWNCRDVIYTGGSFDFPGASVAGGGFAFRFNFPGAPIVPPGAPQLVAGRKSQPILGGQLAVALHRFLWVYGDYGYLFLDKNSVTAQVPFLPSQTATVDTSATRKYWTAAGGVELSAPTVHRIVPFLRAGLWKYASQLQLLGVRTRRDLPSVRGHTD